VALTALAVMLVGGVFAYHLHQRFAFPPGDWILVFQPANQPFYGSGSACPFSHVCTPSRVKSLSVVVVALLISIAALVSSASAQSAAALVPTHHLELFDGKTLLGWTFVSKDTNVSAASIWSVTNGVIVCLGKPHGYARTLRTYRDYRLHVEWRWPDGPGNSGIFLHLNPPDQVWPLCFEAQLLAGDAGELRLNGGSRLSSLADPKARSLPRRHPSSEKPAGEWNVCDIRCRGNTVAIRVNGVLQNEAAGASVDSGAIGLQAEGALVEFRNIFLEPIAPFRK
jgi:hypothetical protein